MVGDESWDLVVLHHVPVETRIKEAAILLSNTKVLILHDTDNTDLTTRDHLPSDFRYNESSDKKEKIYFF